MPNIARHEKLRSLLRDKIVSGKYQPGDRFFSQNELIQKYGLSFSTVTRALDELVRQGYLTRHRGKGTFVSSVSAVDKAASGRLQNVYLFSPWVASQCSSGITDLYRHMEEICPTGMSLKFIPHGPEPDDLEPFLFAREPVDLAVFLYPLEEHFDFIDTLSSNVPAVVLTSGNSPERPAELCTSFARAVEVAADHLLQLGHRQIAVVGTGPGGPETSAMLSGYRKALRTHEVAYKESLVSHGRTHGSRYLSLASVIDCNTDCRISAVIALDNMTALEAASELRTMGMQVPEDVSLVCFDTSDKCPAALSSITTVTFPPARVAAELIKLLAIASPGEPRTARSVEPVLLERGSTAAVRGQST